MANACAGEPSFYPHLRLRFLQSRAPGMQKSFRPKGRKLWLHAVPPWLSTSSAPLRLGTGRNNRFWKMFSGCLAQLNCPDLKYTGRIPSSF